MKNGKRTNRLLIRLILMIAISGITACTAARLYRGEPGTDVSGIRSGISRTQAEAILGVPLRCWYGTAGILYCLYNYDAGVPGSRSDASGFAIMDVITLGTFELFELLPPQYRLQKTHETGYIVISYDLTDTILGVFGETDELPEDARTLNTDAPKSTPQ